MGIRHFSAFVLICILFLDGCGGSAQNSTTTSSASASSSASSSSSGGNSGGNSSGGFSVSRDQIIALSDLAYVYGLAPAIVSKKTYDQVNSTASEAVFAPLNALYIDTQINSPTDALWVTPNVDVLYASAHMDLTSEPMMLYTPALTDRYYSWEILDAYTNAFHYVGSRATGGVQATYAFVGPDTPAATVSAVPSGTVIIQCPTDNIWMVGRFEVAPNNQEDLDTVIGIVQTHVLLPLSQFVTRPADYVNPIIQKPAQTVPSQDITDLNFFTVLNNWMTENPPPAADQPTLQKIAAIGVGPGMQTNFNALPSDQQQALLAGEQLASDELVAEDLLSGNKINGWSYNLGPNFGDWGTSYLIRAATAQGGLGANINQEAIYPVCILDQFLQQMTPGNQYTVTFPSGQLPVVNTPGFWSITMYDLTDAQLVANSINRYALGSQDTLNTNADGSTTIYIQQSDPGGSKTANWLPTASSGSDPFYLIMRAYNPNPVMYTPTPVPTYQLPQVLRTL